MSAASDARVRVAMLGAGYIGQVHSLALSSARHGRADGARPELTLLIDRDEPLAASIAERFGWAAVADDWQAALATADVELFVDAAPNFLHAEPVLAAAARGLAVFCEKPLARTSDEALALLRGVVAADVTHRCAFVHRFVPALRMARELIAAGELGEIRYVRSRFLMDMTAGDGAHSWRFDRERAGPGALGDLGSHHIDVARFLVGEVLNVSALTRTWTTGDGFEANDDAFVALAELEGGATAVFEASRVAEPHALTGTIEIDGTRGALRFEMERMNELELRTREHGPSVRMATHGAALADFPLPVGLQGSHPLGWQDCFGFQMADVLRAAAGIPDAGVCATFRDGYRVAEIVDTIARAAASGAREPVQFRDEQEVAR